MSEKEKRKEKPKRNNRRFIGLSILLTIAMLVGIAWIFSILFKSDESWGKWPTNEAIETANSIALTLISASATAEVSHVRATHAIIRTDAAATLEQAHATAYYSNVQLTATALFACFCHSDTLTAIFDEITAEAATSVVATQNSIATIEAEITSTMVYLQETETVVASTAIIEAVQITPDQTYLAGERFQATPTPNP